MNLLLQSLIAEISGDYPMRALNAMIPLPAGRQNRGELCQFASGRGSQ
jgi:hypothetical protein